MKWIIKGVLLNYLVYMSAIASQPYLGMNFGIQSSAHDAHIRDYTDTYNPSLNKTSAIIGIVAGMQHVFSSQWFLAEEIDFFYGQNRTTFDQNTEAAAVQPVQLSVERTFMTSLSGKFGYKFNKVSPYVRLGIELSSFQTRMQGADPTPAERIGGDKNFIRIAAVPGFGVDIQANQNLVFSFDARFAFYNSYTAHYRSRTGKPGVVTLKPRFTMVTVGMKWMF